MCRLPLASKRKLIPDNFEGIVLEHSVLEFIAERLEELGRPGYPDANCFQDYIQANFAKTLSRKDHHKFFNGSKTWDEVMV